MRADVKDNGYEFLLPNQRSYEQRYVVWTGGDGTPHVQPIVTFAAARAERVQVLRQADAVRGARVARRRVRVRRRRRSPTSSPFRVPRRASRALRLRRQVAAMVYVTRCAARGPLRAGRRGHRPPGPSASGRGAAGPSGAAGRRGPGPARPGARHSRARASPASTADHAPTPSSLDEMAAPRPLVILTLLAVFVASVSVTILAWIAIATAHKAQDVVDKADRLDQRRARPRSAAWTAPPATSIPPSAPCAEPPTRSTTRPAPRP